MNRSMLIPALVAVLSLVGCDTPAFGDASVAPTDTVQPHGSTGNQGIVAGTGGSGAGVVTGRMPTAGATPAAESKYALTNTRRNP